MKKTILTVLKVFVSVLVAWMGLFVTDYFSGSKPMICFDEANKNTANGTFYRCVSLGYKYYENIDNVKGEAFGVVFRKSEIEKELGEF